MAKEEINLSFGGHLKELQRTLLQSVLIVLVGVAGAFCFYREIFDILTYPLETGVQGVDLSSSSAVFRFEGTPIDLILLHPLEGFTSVLQMCIWTGIFVTLPFWLARIVLFILPALHFGGRKVVWLFLALTVPFLIGGFAFGFLVVIPLLNRYFYAFNSSLGTNLWSLSTYLDYTLMLLGAFIVIFEACVGLLLLVHLGVLTRKMLKEKRRHLIISAFVIGAFLTPPDVMSQCLVALPLIGLYELAILYGKLIDYTFTSHECKLDLSCRGRQDSSATVRRAN